jgi:hypothetical protein
VPRTLIWKLRPTLVALLALTCSNTHASAQNVNQLMNLFGGIMRSAITQATQSEWACVDNQLRQRGSSIQALIEPVITPADGRVTDLRSFCRGPQPSQAMRTEIPTSNYVVDGLALGGRVRFDSQA